MEPELFQLKIGLDPDIGFCEVSVQPFDFLHPLVPSKLITGIDRIGRLIERLPLLKEISGSLLICGHKPVAASCIPRILPPLIRLL